MRAYSYVTHKQQGVLHWSTLFSKWNLSEFRFLYGHDEYSLEIQIILFSYLLAVLSKILWQKCVLFLSYRTVSKFVVNKAVKAIAKVVSSIVLHTSHQHAVDPKLYGFWYLSWTWNTCGEHVLQNIFTNCYIITAVSDFCITSCCDLMSCKEQQLTCSIVDHLHHGWCMRGCQQWTVFGETHQRFQQWHCCSALQWLTKNHQHIATSRSWIWSSKMVTKNDG